MKTKPILVVVCLSGFGCSADSPDNDMDNGKGEDTSAIPDCAPWSGDREACESAGCRSEGGEGDYCMLDGACHFDPKARSYCVWVGDLEGLQIGGGYFRRADGVVTEFSQVYPKGALEEWGNCWGALAPDEWEEGAPAACACVGGSTEELPQGVCP